MSIDPAAFREKRRRDAWLSFFILSGFAVAFLGMGLTLGTEPRMYLERTSPHGFRVTGSNHIAGVQFYSRTIEGVEGARLASGARSDRRDSLQERQLQQKRRRLDFTAANGAVLSWGRTDDSPLIDQFMRGPEPVLDLRDPPPWWRAALSWGSLAFGALIFIAALRSFLPKKPSGAAWR